MIIVLAAALILLCVVAAGLGIRTSRINIMVRIEVNEDDFRLLSVWVIEFHVYYKGVADLVWHRQGQIVLIRVCDADTLMPDQFRFFGYLVVKVHFEIVAGEDSDVDASLSPIQEDCISVPGLDANLTCQLHLKLSHSF